MLLLFLAQIAASEPRPLGFSTPITSSDYPAEAISKRWQGDVVINLTVAKDGRATQCNIIRSSGHQVLDDATCKLFTTRAKFGPALDENGRPIEGHIDRYMNWRL